MSWIRFVRRFSVPIWLVSALVAEAQAFNAPDTATAPQPLDSVPAVAVPVEPEYEYLLDLPLDQLLQVSVSSATRSALSLQQAPANISVISADDFEKYQYQSIAESLQAQAGFDVLYDLSFYNAGVRGVSAGLNGQSNILKAMIDGQDMAFSPTNGNLLGPEFIPTLAIKRVEVIRGPMSALYGANALLGTLNVVPQTAKDLQHSAQNSAQKNPGNIRSRLTYGDWWGNAASTAEVLAWGQPAGFDMVAAASRTHSERSGLELPASSPRYERLRAQKSPASIDDVDDSSSFYLRIARDYSAHEQLLLDLSLQHLERSAAFQPDSEPLTPARTELDNQMLRLRYHTSLFSDWSVQISGALKRAEPGAEDRAYDPFRVGIAYIERRYRSLQYSSEALLRYVPTPNFSLNVSVDYTFDQQQLPELHLYGNDGSLETVDGNRSADFDNLGLALQLQWRLLADLSATAGVRVDEPSLFERQTSYRAGLVYGIERNSQIKLLHGTAYKAPSTMLMFGGEHPRLLGPAANGELRPQQASTSELVLSTLLREHLHLSGTLYHTRIDDFAEYDTIAANPQARNRAQIVAQGIELESRLQLRAPAFELVLKYALVETEISRDEVIAINTTDQSRLYPENTWSLAAHYQNRGGWWRAFAQWQYVDERLADNSNLPFLPIGAQQQYALPAYQLLDLGIASVGWQVFGRQESKFILSCKNVLDERYTEPGFSGIDVPGQGRRLWLSWQQTF